MSISRKTLHQNNRLFLNSSAIHKNLPSDKFLTNSRQSSDTSADLKLLLLSPLNCLLGLDSNRRSVRRAGGELSFWNVSFSCTGKWSEDSTFVSVAGTFHSAGL